MISITDKHDCCGCGACAEACPRRCITMAADREGFLYPAVDAEACVHCGFCERVCPMINIGDERKPAVTYAAVNTDDAVRMASSSGGVFSALAARTIARGGVVFGAAFTDDCSVEHTGVTSPGGLAALRGSKYLQSRTGHTYGQAKEALKSGVDVLFSGTACQIAGLKRYLRKDYANLLTVDVVCHGVPSPAVWQAYLKDKNLSDGACGDIQFRDKKEGWKNYRVKISRRQNASAGCGGVVVDEPFYENAYMQAFLSNLTLRPSCYRCPAKGGRCGSDLTLGDFWGIGRVAPGLDDDRGCSLVLVNTPEGAQALSGLNLKMHERAYAEALAGNPSIETPVAELLNRRYFFRMLRLTGSVAVAQRLSATSRLPLRALRILLR